MNNLYKTSDNEKQLLSSYGADDGTGYYVPMVDSSDHQHHPPPRRQGPPSTWQRLTARIFKVSLSVIMLILMLLVFVRVGYDTYSECLEHMGGDGGMRHGEGRPWHHLSEHRPHQVPHHPDCRKTGCDSDSACVKLNAHMRCYAQPCPPELFLCLPLALPENPKDAVAPIQNSDASNTDRTDNHAHKSPSPGRKHKITEAFFDCLRAHDGNVVWTHPTDKCNTCRCLPGGGISCTKRLCSAIGTHPGSEEAANSKAPKVSAAV
ncbi:hypothetical protein H4217_003318 [Coemansia sp. RSA 1939]|nr:hypothetical protein H4217_003318 [Coemansia sp. RSA 1939]KAJ2611408.1 hypothetical protein EV177_003496 [Coemansia sp. RSA 1804]